MCALPQSTFCRDFIAFINDVSEPAVLIRCVPGQGKSEEEVLAIGKAAAAEAAANVEKSVEDKDDMDDDAQARYYRCGNGNDPGSISRVRVRL